MLEDRNPLSLFLDVTSHTSASVVAGALRVFVLLLKLWPSQLPSSGSSAQAFLFLSVEGSADSQQRPRGGRTTWGVFGLVFLRSPLSQCLRKLGAGYFWKGVTPGFCGIISGPCAILQPL